MGTLLKTVQELQHVINKTLTARATPGSMYRVCDCDEVYPGMHVGDEVTARNKDYLRQQGITHVLNTAEGAQVGQVNTNAAFYSDVPTLTYLGFPLIDLPTSDIMQYFDAAAKFIAEAIASGGRVLVHCYMGRSRSASCAVAYLMMYKGMTACEAMSTVCGRRFVMPNSGFLRQLAELDDKLRAQKSSL